MVCWKKTRLQSIFMLYFQCCWCLCPWSSWFPSTRLVISLHVFNVKIHFLLVGFWPGKWGAVKLIRMVLSPYKSLISLRLANYWITTCWLVGIISAGQDHCGFSSCVIFIRSLFRWLKLLSLLVSTPWLAVKSRFLLLKCLLWIATSL